VVIASKRIIDDLFLSKATDIFMVFMHRCNSFGADLEIEKKSKEDLRHEFEAMKKESEMAMETLKKESEMARAKQAEEIKKKHHKKPCPSFIKCLVLGMVELGLVAGCLPLVLVALTLEPCCWFHCFATSEKYCAAFKLCVDTVFCT